MKQPTPTVNHVMQQEQPVVSKKHYSWDDTLKTLMIAVVLAISFRSLAFEPFHIPSGSMKSNLLIGDYLFVSKYSYGYSRYSFPFGFKWFEGRVFGAKPERGDVIVFRYPQNPRIDYIKRLIGLPGDSIQMKDGIVYINGTALKRRQIDDYVDDEVKSNIHNVARFVETLPEGKAIEILKEKRYGPADDTPVFVVPEGHYFFMGDNRDNSRDSRFMNEVGFVPEENLVGKALVVFCSVDGGGSCFNPTNWFTTLRSDRFLKPIE